MKGKQNAYSLQQNKKFVLDKGYSLVTEDYIQNEIIAFAPTFSKESDGMINFH